jgi:hypothetical protein
MPNSKLNFKKAIILYSLLFLFSIVIIGFHHHDDDFQHSDCPICIAGCVYSCENSQVDVGLAIQHVFSYLYSFKEVSSIQKPIFPTFAYRAPPFTSIV